MGIDPNLLGSVQGPAPVFEPVSASQQQNQTPQDSLQAADQVAAAAYFLSASSPTLPPPDYEISLNITKTAGVTGSVYYQVVTEMDELHSETVSKLLDSWSKQQEEESRRAHEWMTSPAYKQMLEVRFPDQNSERLTQINLNLGQARDGVLAASTELSPSNAAFMAGSLIIGAGMMVDFSAAFAGSTAMAEGIPSFQNLVTDPNLVVQLGFIGSMISAGALNNSVMQTLFDAAQKGKRPTEAEAARNFAARMLNIVSDPAFAGHVLFRMIDRMPGAEKMPEQVKNQMVAIVKAIMLATALAALYKGETKWLGEEVKNLLEGNLEGFFKGGSPEEQRLRLSVGLQLQAAFAELSLPQRQSLMNALVKYFKSNPSLKQLSNIGSTFDNVTAEIAHKELPV